MTPRTVSILLLTAIISVAAATYGVSTRVDYQSTDFRGERLFPGLLENAGNVGEVTLLQNGDTMTFIRKDDIWTLKQSGGYPVHANLVNKVIFGLSNMELLEPRTRKPELFAELNLGDPSKKKSSAQQVTLKSSSGEMIADLVIGRANFFLPETTTGGMYVRRPGEDQTWLVRGLVDIGVEPRDWLIRDIVDIKPERIVRAEVTQPDGEKLIVIPKEGVTGSFAFENMPEGMKLKSEFAPRNIAAVLNGFVLNDVRPAADVALAPEDAYVTEFFSVDAIHVTTRMWQQDKTHYMTVAAAYIGDDANSDAAKQANAIAARTQGWAYIIPDYQYEQIAKKMTDVTEKSQPDS
ncbi:DUF4340 domain-containing protein [Thalassospiraceae bacterium LMO-JJ14]|nr:DUF4340 domain-containing protein [Thalassospiraceae bacterium LMO-JJ14]